MNYSLTEFFKISGKYDHNADFLTQSLKIFQQNQDEFQDNYTNFLENLDFTVENYEKKVVVSQVHFEFKEKMNYTLTDFFKISEKYDHKVDFLNQSLNIFQQNQEEFQDNYTNFLENLDFTVENYKKKVAVSQVHFEFKEKINYNLTDFLKIAEKYDHKVDFLTQSLKIFQQNQDEFQDNYTNFLENLDFTVENYKKKVAVSQVHFEFKEKMNYTLTDFFKISEKYDHKVDFLTQSLKIFQQNQEEFHDNYTNFLENIDFTVENYEKKVAVSQVHLEFKEKYNESLT